MTGTWEQARGDEGLHTAEVEAYEGEPVARRILDAIAQPVLLFDEGFQITFANRPAHERFDLGRAARTCHEILYGRSEVCSGCPVRSSQTGESAASELRLREKTYRVRCRRLEEPIEDSRHMVTIEEAREETQTFRDAVRRMKHRFNNYLAPMAGKAEIILFALQKGNHAKAAKAANDILQYAEDTSALDRLFELGAGQECKSIKDYVS